MKLPPVIREISFLAVFMLLFLLLFFIQGILQQVDYTKGAEEKITGEVIRVGQQIIVNATEPEPKQHHVSIPSPTITNKNLQCWSAGGITAEDLAIAGTLLQGTSCILPKERKPVAVRSLDDCLHVAVGNEALTKFCFPDEEQPSLHLELPAGGEGTVVPPATRQNYLPAIVFLLILFFVFGFWSWDELRTTFAWKKRFMPYDALELRYGKDRVPHYNHAQQTPPSAEEASLAETYLHFAKEKQRPLSGTVISQRQIATYIARFHQFATALSAAISKNDITNVRRTYEQLLDVFFPLYRAVPEQQQKTLLQTIRSFDRQVSLLKKSSKINYLIREAYQHTNKHKVA